MNKIYKAALLAALGLGSITAAQAQTYSPYSDLVLGFNDAASATSTHHNDYVIDLGAISSLTSGETWNINSSLFTAAFGTDVTLANNIAVGIVGGNTPPTGENDAFTTLIGNPTTIPSKTALKIATGGAWAQGLLLGVNSSSTPATSGGWSGAVAASPLSIGSGQTVSGNLGQPLSYLSSGVVSENLYHYSYNADNGTVYTPVLVGTFSIDANANTITFVAPVPEPSTLGLMGIAGLAALPLCRKLTRKNS